MVKGFVYVIGAPGATVVKIGRTIHLEKRLGEIQRMSPIPLALLWSHPGDHELECNLHRHFSDKRRHGEWFYFDADPVGVVRAAVEDEPWLRPKVILTKSKAQIRARAKRAATSLAAATPPRELKASTRTWVEKVCANLGQVIEAEPDLIKRYALINEATQRVRDVVRQVQKEAVLELKGQGRTWREIGDILGVTGSRAEQISRAAR
jgi:hypothetical protein